MRGVISILENLEASGGRLLKEEILENETGNDLLKTTLVAALDPYVNYGIAKFKMPPACSSSMERDEDETIAKFHVLLARLAMRELSGNAARDALIGFLATCTLLEQKWCKRILLQNLRAGIQASTVNKVFPDLIRTFKVQLAATLDTEHVDGQIVINELITYPIRLEPKLDGLRLIAIKHLGEVTMWTRNGREVETLPTIMSALQKLPVDDIVLDGEAMGDDWNESSSIIGSKKNKKDDSNINLNVFDAMTYEEWTTQNARAPMRDRVKFVETITNLAGDQINAVTGITVDNEDELLNFYEACLDEGYEGIMLKDLAAPYEFKRSRRMWKMKPVATFEGVIVGAYKGRDGTSREHGFGGFNVIFPNGMITNCGGGFSAALQLEFTTVGMETYVGRIIEVEGQPILTKEGRIRWPEFIRWRDPADVDPKVVEAYEIWKAAQ